jgi:hypothetical protein
MSSCGHVLGHLLEGVGLRRAIGVQVGPVLSGSDALIFASASPFSFQRVMPGGLSVSICQRASCNFRLISSLMFFSAP